MQPCFTRLACFLQEGVFCQRIRTRGLRHARLTYLAGSTDRLGWSFRSLRLSAVLGCLTLFSPTNPPPRLCPFVHRPGRQTTPRVPLSETSRHARRWWRHGSTDRSSSCDTQAPSRFRFRFRFRPAPTACRRRGGVWRRRRRRSGAPAFLSVVGEPGDRRTQTVWGHGLRDKGGGGLPGESGIIIIGGGGGWFFLREGGKTGGSESGRWWWWWWWCVDGAVRVVCGGVCQAAGARGGGDQACDSDRTGSSNGGGVFIYCVPSIRLQCLVEEFFLRGCARGAEAARELRLHRGPCAGTVH